MPLTRQDDAATEDNELDLDDDEIKLPEDDEQVGQQAGQPAQEEAAGEDGAAEDERARGPEEEPQGQDSASVKDRIAKLTFQRREAERIAAAREAENQVLQEQLTHVHERLSRIESAGEEANEQALAQSIEQLEAQLEQAIEEGDAKGQAALNAKLIDAHATARMNAARRDHAQRMAQQRQIQAQQAQQQRPTPLAEQWKIENADWFGQQGFEQKTARVMEIDRSVAADGYNVNTPAYYQELDRRIGAAFPEDNARPQPQRGNGQSRQTNSPVTPANRGNGQRKSRDIKLSADELRIARDLGLADDAKKMAAYKKEIAKSRAANG